MARPTTSPTRTPTACCPTRSRSSASLLQRRLKVGYARAARIIDQLEARGYIGAFDGSNARVVMRRDDGYGDHRSGDNGADPGDD